MKDGIRATRKKFKEPFPTGNQTGRLILNGISQTGPELKTKEVQTFYELPKGLDMEESKDHIQTKQLHSYKKHNPAGQFQNHLRSHITNLVEIAETFQHI